MATQEEILGGKLEAFQKAILFAYSRPAQLDRMLEFKMKVARPDIAADGPMVDVTFAVLKHFKAAGHLTSLLHAALSFMPDSPPLKSFAIACIQPDAPAELRKLLRMNDQPAESRDVQAIQRPPTSFPVSSLRLAVQEVAARVGQVENDLMPHATGFLVGPDLFLTCHYVIQDIKNPPQSMRLRFPNVDHTIPENRIVSLAEKWRVAWSRLEDLDYVLLRLAEPAGEDKASARRRGWLQLESTQNSAQVSGGNSNIIQLHYPEGRAQTASFVATLKGGEGSRLHYEYATAPGSGGAPCLSADFIVLALREKGSMDRSRGEGVLASEIFLDLTRQGIDLPKL